MKVYVIYRDDINGESCIGRGFEHTPNDGIYANLEEAEQAVKEDMWHVCQINEEEVR